MSGALTVSLDDEGDVVAIRANCERKDFVGIEFDVRSRQCESPAPWIDSEPLGGRDNRHCRGLNRIERLIGFGKGHANERRDVFAQPALEVEELGAGDFIDKGSRRQVGAGFLAGVIDDQDGAFAGKFEVDLPGDQRRSGALAASAGNGRAGQKGQGKYWPAGRSRALRGTSRRFCEKAVPS